MLFRELPLPAAPSAFPTYLQQVFSSCLIDPPFAHAVHFLAQHSAVASGPDRYPFEDDWSAGLPYVPLRVVSYHAGLLNLSSSTWSLHLLTFQVGGAEEQKAADQSKSTSALKHLYEGIMSGKSCCLRYKKHLLLL